MICDTDAQPTSLVIRIDGNIWLTYGRRSPHGLWSFEVWIVKSDELRFSLMYRELALIELQFARSLLRIAFSSMFRSRFTCESDASRQISLKSNSWRDQSGQVGSCNSLA